MAAEAENKRLVQRLYEEAFNQHNLAILDDLLAPDFLDHSPLEGQAPGREGFRQSVAKGQASVSDMCLTLEEIIAEGELVAVRQRVQRPHEGKTVEFTGMGFFRCREGKIIEAWWNIDTLSMLQQLGVVHLD
jgi:predicted SnoaL-like aldol condensation-catalyzing enzyme